MRVFDFDVDEAAAAYAAAGWVHLKGGATGEIVAAVADLADRMAAESALGGPGIKGQKDQFLFDFPAGTDLGAELFDVLAPMCGLRRETLTLSERHVKAYQPDAAPMPSAHKDRLASQVAVGISVRVPAGSHLVLYPDDDRETNPFLSTGFRDSLEPDEQPDVVLREAREVQIHDEPGDVIIFPGSSMWHLRRNAAGTVNLYLKFNDFGSDPLGEDPSTAEFRRTTMRLLDGDIAGCVPQLSRRFDSIVRSYRRVAWQEALEAVVWGQPPVPVGELEVGLLRALDGGRTVADLLRGAGADAVEAERAVRRLAERNVIDLTV